MILMWESLKFLLKSYDLYLAQNMISVWFVTLNQDQMEKFILDQLDKVNLGHNTFTKEAIALIARSADGVIRKCRNLCLSCFLEAVRDRKKCIDIDIVNKILIQPHWRNESDMQQPE